MFWIESFSLNQIKCHLVFIKYSHSQCFFNRTVKWLSLLRSTKLGKLYCVQNLSYFFFFSFASFNPLDAGSCPVHWVIKLTAIGKPESNFTHHLKNQEKKSVDDAEVLALPKDCKEQKKMLNRLWNRGTTNTIQRFNEWDWTAKTCMWGRICGDLFEHGFQTSGRQCRLRKNQGLVFGHDVGVRAVNRYPKVFGSWWLWRKTVSAPFLTFSSENKRLCQESGDNCPWTATNQMMCGGTETDLLSFNGFKGAVFTEVRHMVNIRAVHESWSLFCYI